MEWQKLQDNLWSGSTIRDNLNKFKKDMQEFDFLIKLPSEMFSQVLAAQNEYYRRVHDEFMHTINVKQRDQVPYALAEATTNAVLELYKTTTKTNEIMQATANELQRHALEKMHATIMQMQNIFSVKTPASQSSCAA